MSLLPLPNDKDAQLDYYEIYSKYHQSENNDNKGKDRIQTMIDNCNVSDFDFQPHQKMLRDFMSPVSPYKGLLVYHEPGTGKTLATISMAMEYQEQVMQYQNKIIILVPRPNTKQVFLNEMLYYKKSSNNSFLELTERDFEDSDKQLIKEFREVFSIYTQKSFLKMVIGEKLKNVSTGKYLKNDKGNIQRTRSVKKLNFLVNTILFIDEAHNMISNDGIGKAIDRIIHSKKTKNLKVVLLTATPMKNTVKDIVPLMNFILPKEEALEIEKILEKPSDPVDQLKLKKGWKDYFREKVGNRISYLESSTITSPDLEFVGDSVPDGDTFKIFKCEMMGLQKDIYLQVEKQSNKSFNRDLQSVQLFCFPYYDTKKDKILTDKINDLNKFIDMKFMRNNLMTIEKKNIYPKYLKAVSKLIKKKVPNDFINFNDGIINGLILNEEYIKYFSIKLYNCIQNILGNYESKQFVYSERVEVGVLLFANVLIQNGFIQYNPNIYDVNGSYNESSYGKVRCFECGVVLSKHSDKSHQYHPATFITIKGDSDDDEDNGLRDEYFKQFNNPNNDYGSRIKIIVGSSVMREGLSLKTTSCVHLLEAPFTVTRIQQIVGRARRHCSHVNIVNKNKPFPIVKVYLYSTSLKNKTTNDEMTYIKANRKYKLIKEVEEHMKSISWDCAIQYNRNTKFTGKCISDKLNEKYYDEKTKKYRPPIVLKTSGLEFNEDDENYCTKLIKEFYFFKSIEGRPYSTLNEITEFIKSKYNEKNDKGFNINNVYSAISKFILKSQKDILTNSNWLIDNKLNQGYLIQINIPLLNNKEQNEVLYIFQSKFKNDNLTLFERTNIFESFEIPLYDVETFIKQFMKKEYQKFLNQTTDYEYDDRYYSEKYEFKVIGIIAKGDNDWGKFNLGKGVSKDTIFGRKKGQRTKFGQHYHTKSIDELRKYLKYLSIDYKEKKLKRNIIGELIFKKLISLEQTNKDNICYIKVPTNHIYIPFPLNLHDRKKKLLNLEKEYSQFINIEKSKNKFLVNILKSDEKLENIILNEMKATEIDATNFEIDFNEKEYDFRDE